MVDWDTLQQNIKVVFNDISLLKQAFQHASFVNEKQDQPLADNERLEFLGDSVLNFVVSKKICGDYPDYKEGELTVLRTLLIREDTLAELAHQLDLGQYLQLGKGEESSGGRERPSNLADTFEALIGAIYLDSGLDSAENFILTGLRKKFGEIKAEKMAQNYKAILQEFTQAEFKQLPDYHIIETSGPDHEKNFLVEVQLDGKTIGTGSGKTKKHAEQEAARLGCSALGIL